MLQIKYTQRAYNTLLTMKNNCTKGISQLSEDRWLNYSVPSTSLSLSLFLRFY